MYVVFVYEKLDKGEKEHLVMRTKSFEEASAKANAAVQHPKCLRSEIFKAYIAVHKPNNKPDVKAWERPKAAHFSIGDNQ